MRGVTRIIYNGKAYDVISTHTPHARRDAELAALEWRNGNFNSHASCEA